MLTQTDEPCQAPPSRPGFARRAENYPDIVAQAQTFTGLEGVTAGLIYRILIDGFPHLRVSRTAFHLLLNLVGHLTAEDWAKGSAIVWPSNERLADQCDVTVRQVQRALGELEHAGLVIRAYTHRHSRMTRNKRNGAEGGIDLAPLGSKLPALSSAVQVKKAEIADRRERRHRRVHDVSYMSDNSCPDEISDTHEQSHLKQSINTVRAAAKASDQSDASRRNTAGISVEGSNQKRYSGATTEIRSSDDETGFSTRAKRQPTILAETPKIAILRAYRLSPTLQEVVAEGEILEASLDDLMAIFRRAVASLMPQRNTTMTWDWMVKYHGWRAAIAFIVALEEPGVSNRSGYFGYFLKPDLPKPLNFSSNFKRIAAARREVVNAHPADANRPGRVETASPPVDGLWGAVVARLSQTVAAASVTAWILPLTFLENENGVLRLSARSMFAKDWIDREFRDGILRAARAEDPSIRAVTIEHGTN